MTQMCKNGQCIGFNIWSHNKNDSRVILGAVRPQYVNSGIAFFLYKHTLKVMKDMGISRISKWVYSSNVNALNMHNLLFESGYKFGDCRDEWVWSRNQTS
jgi:GNAT superfamily N-acetyltransferase